MKYLENRFPPALVAVFFGAGMWVTSLLMPPTKALNEGIKYATVGLFVALGALFLISGVVYFRLAKTTVNPLKPGTATSLVTSGIYQITRNPMYVGIVLFVCAWAVFLGSIWTVAFIVLYILFLHRFHILPEEKALEDIFGEEFINYKNRVRPWL